MTPVSEPSDDIPISESINGSWKLVIWKDTAPFMQKRSAGAVEDHRFVRSIHKFSCDGVRFHESHVLSSRKSFDSSCVMGKKNSDANRKWWTSVRNNVLESTLQIYFGKKNAIYVHENRYIRKGRLHISSHFNVKTNGKKEDTQCLRIFDRVPEGEMPETSNVKMAVIPPLIGPVVTFERMARWMPVDEVPVKPIDVKSDGFKQLLATKDSPKVVVEQKEKEKKKKNRKDRKKLKKALKETPETQETQETPVQSNPITETPVRPSKDCKLPVIPMVADEQEESAEDSTSWEVKPIDESVWEKVPLIEPPRPLGFSGDWKFSSLIGWSPYLSAIQIDKDLIWATSNLSITQLNIFLELWTKYSTPGGMEHETLEKLREPIHENGTSKTVYFEKDSLIAITEDSKTGEEISKMTRSVEGGKLKTEYECMEYKFTVLHEKVY